MVITLTDGLFRFIFCLYSHLNNPWLPTHFLLLHGSPALRSSPVFLPTRSHLGYSLEMFSVLSVFFPKINAYILRKKGPVALPMQLNKSPLDVDSTLQRTATYWIYWMKWSGLVTPHRYCNCQVTRTPFLIPTHLFNGSISVTFCFVSSIYHFAHMVKWL